METIAKGGIRHGQSSAYLSESLFWICVPITSLCVLHSHQLELAALVDNFDWIVAGVLTNPRLRSSWELTPSKGGTSPPFRYQFPLSKTKHSYNQCPRAYRRSRWWPEIRLCHGFFSFFLLLSFFFFMSFIDSFIVCIFLSKHQKYFLTVCFLDIQSKEGVSPWYILQRYFKCVHKEIILVGVKYSILYLGFYLYYLFSCSKYLCLRSMLNQQKTRS